MKEETENIYQDFGSESGNSDSYAKSDGPTSVNDAPRAGRNERKERDSSEKIQWAYGGNHVWRACGITEQKLPSAVFSVFIDDYGESVFKELNVVTDNLYRLPDAATDYVLSLIEKFWKSKHRFKERGYLFKRGILLCGDPGGGKTSIIQLLSKQLLDLGGMVVFADNPVATTKALQTLRQVEPERPLIVILEDLDELVRRFTEAEWLALLDGESQIDNVVYIGTTNYPKKLDRRFVNRPSRFDEIIVVEMPTAAARRKYLEIKSNGDLTPDEIETWVKDTEGMSVAHLRELYIAVFCLELEYGTVLNRIKLMQAGRGYRDADETAAVKGFGK